jgi:hypothetical protein
MVGADAVKASRKSALVDRRYGYKIKTGRRAGRYGTGAADR